MNAFVNGALSALSNMFKLLERVDPENKDAFVQDLKKQINLYAELYEAMESSGAAVEDNTWMNISATDDDFEADEEEISGPIFKA